MTYYLALGKQNTNKYTIGKAYIDYGKLFQRIGAVWLYERLDILREEAMVGGVE